MIHFKWEQAISDIRSERDQKIEFYYYNKVQKRPQVKILLFSMILKWIKLSAFECMPECPSIHNIPLIDSSTQAAWTPQVWFEVCIFVLQ